MKKINFKTVSLKDQDFDYKEMLLSFFKSDGWASSHPIKGPKDVDLAMKVSSAFRGDEDGVTVEDDAADYICGMAAELPFRPGAEEDQLEAIHDFKSYFEEVKKTKSVAPEK